MLKPLGTVWSFAIGEPATKHGIVALLTREGVDGATILPAYGIWQGKTERTWVVQIAGTDAFKAVKLAEALRVHFAQESVYVEHQGQAFLVEGSYDYGLDQTQPAPRVARAAYDLDTTLARIRDSISRTWNAAPETIMENLLIMVIGCVIYLLWSKRKKNHVLEAYRRNQDYHAERDRF